MLSSTISSLFTLFPLLSLISTLSTISAASICNGQSSLCSRSYSSVTFIGAHDSYAVGQNLADNQNKDITSALNDGIRTLQVQAHLSSDGIHLCHTSCALQDGGLFSTYLSKLASWVNNNPNDVVTLVIVNSNNLPVTQYASIFQQTGMDKLAYIPTSSSTTLSSWPSLGSMIDSGKRVVVFMDYQANFNQVPYIIDEFTNMWEDAYNVVDQTFSCAVNRSQSSTATSLYMINHYLDITYTIAGTQLWVPARDKLNITNGATGYGSIGAHVGNCNAIWGRNPNHILLDYYDTTGNVPFILAAQLNGIPAPTNNVIPAVTTIAPTASGTGSAGITVVSTKSLGAASKRIGSMDGKGLSLGLGLIGAISGVLVGGWLL